ncbi:MAG: CoA transferase [Planctomycetes bacterium]|nr:CoA transferase [Planctomycetota bacterium]
MKPLQGLLVLDLSRVLAGPFCTMRLADLGADVIKVESPEGDPTRRFGPPFLAAESPYFMSFNRGKRSIALDLKTASGRGFVERVLERADVLVDNFRPGVLERLGLGEDRRRQLNPRLIQVTITGYGPESPRHADAAFDLAIQAESGLMAMTGEPDSEPVRTPISIADLAASAAAIEAVLAALFRRERTGEGARIEVSLLESLIAIFGYQAQSPLATGLAPERMGHRHPNLMPYQAFATRDGFLVLAVGTDEQWRRLIAVEGLPGAELDRPEWTRNAGRVRDRERIEALIATAFVLQDGETWRRRLLAADVPFGMVRDVVQALDELRAQDSSFLRQVRHATLGEVEMTTGPIMIAGEGRQVAELAPPVLDQHHDELLVEFARDAEELARWRSETR